MVGSVVLVGKLGHGKTEVINKLTGSRFPSAGGAESCTRCLQCAHSRRHRINIIDTAGLESKDEPAKHLAIQKIGLESQPLSAVCVVVKADRPDVMDKPISAIMDAIGNVNEDLVRIIATHADVERTKSGFDEEAYKIKLAGNLSMDAKNITFIGKHDDPTQLEDWLHGVLDPTPRKLTLEMDQLAGLAALSSAARKYDRDISECILRMEAAKACLLEEAGAGKTEETDQLIVAMQASVEDMVQRDKEQIFKNVVDATPDTQNLVYGKAGVSLSIKLKKFMEDTNKMLSWDVTDPHDYRNQYKTCNNCGAVYILAEGCEGETTCGAVPGMETTEKPALTFNWERQGDKHKVQIRLSGVKVWGGALRDHLRRLRQSKASRRTGIINLKRKGVIESGCGAKIAWRTMLPITAAQLQAIQAEWGKVELVKPGQAGALAEKKWEVELEQQVMKVKEELKRPAGEAEAAKGDTKRRKESA